MDLPNVTPAAELRDRTLIASAAWASGRFGLGVHVAEMVRGGASPNEVVTATWDAMAAKLEAAASLSRIGPHEGSGS